MKRTTSNMAEFELEAYWGNPNGELLHGTIRVKANSIEEALRKARAERLKPPSNKDHFDSCARDEYFEDHYDVEILSEGFEDATAIENWRTAIRSVTNRT